jgi:alpha-galactosidase
MAEVTALRVSDSLDMFPPESDWTRAQPVRFSHDWQGCNPDAFRETEVRLLWNSHAIFVNFRCRYRSITVFSDAGANGRRDELWDRDVAEVFLQADRFGEKYYKEFEVSPNGQWLDLDITPEGLHHVASGMRSRVLLDDGAKIWTAELAIPISAVCNSFDPAQPWRLNFFRCEGVEPQRFYSCWQPTETQMPNFHVPQKFGVLRFQP